MSRKTTMDPKDYCILQGCSAWAGPWCIHCGFCEEEDERRKRLPLVMDENGIRRKYVGVQKNDGDR